MGLFLHVTPYDACVTRATDAHAMRFVHPSLDLSPGRVSNSPPHQHFLHPRSAPPNKDLLMSPEARLRLLLFGNGIFVGFLVYSVIYDSQRLTSGLAVMILSMASFYVYRGINHE